MKSFKQILSEAVPNRFHGQVFKQFYDMGRRGTYPWSEELISKISTVQTPEKDLVHSLFGGGGPSMVNKDAPTHIMTFPSFKNDSEGKILTTQIKTEPSDLNYNDLGLHDPVESLNRIDLRQVKGLSDATDILGHEAFHWIQTERAQAGTDHINDRFIDTIPDRNYHDSLGNLRTTNDLQYANHMFRYQWDTSKNNRYLNKIIKQKELLRGKKLSKDEIDKIVYRHDDFEHDARIGGTIARLASREGSQSAYADRPKFRYSEFLKATDPQTRRQERRTRKSFGRIAQAWQDTTGKKINPDPES